MIRPRQFTNICLTLIQPRLIELIELLCFFTRLTLTQPRLIELFELLCYDSCLTLTQPRLIELIVDYTCI